MLSHPENKIPLQEMNQYSRSNIRATISVSSTMLRFDMYRLLQNLLHFIEKKGIPLRVCIRPSRNDIWSQPHNISDNT